MQFEALFMALLIDPPSVKAATAMPVPTIARISAYSAAEAPLVSIRRFLIVVITFPHSPPKEAPGSLIIARRRQERFMLVFRQLHRSIQKLRIARYAGIAFEEGTQLTTKSI
jgi:hypothetical protein